MNPERKAGPEPQWASPEQRRPELSQPAARTTAGSRSGTPYTPRPEERKPPRRRKPWAALLCVLVLAIAGGYGALAYLAPGASGGFWPFTAGADSRVLRVTTQDIDAEATEMARAMLASGEWNAALNPDRPNGAPDARGKTSKTAIPVSGTHAGLTPAPATEVAPGQAASQPLPSAREVKRQRVRAILQTAPESTRRDLEEGRQALYDLHVIDNMEEDGDAVIIQVNGIPYGEVTLSHAGQTLLIPLPAGALSQLRVLAIRDGGGGVTFGARSSVGDVRSKVMQVGDSDNWTVVPR